MFDVITFGSATRDIFLTAKQFVIGNFKKDNIEKEILLPFGQKINVDNMNVFCGGGGINTASTFVAQGLKSAFCGVVGNDLSGETIIKELKSNKINIDFVYKAKKESTNTSVIFSTPNERTILVYKGASKEFVFDKFSANKLKNTKWFYVSTLGDNRGNKIKSLVDFAKKNNIKVMLNPGNGELKLPTSILKSILSKVDILSLNNEEAQTLSKTNLSGQSLIKEIRKIYSGILIITNGEEKLIVVDEKNIYTAIPNKAKALDKTGAGDAYGSGFLSAYIRSSGKIEDAIQLGLANSASCIKKWGSKEGILLKGAKFKKVKILKNEF